MARTTPTTPHRKWTARSFIDDPRWNLPTGTALSTTAIAEYQGASLSLFRGSAMLCSIMMRTRSLALAALVAALCGLGAHAAPGDAAWQAWLQSLWPPAQERGVSRATFD